MPGKLPILLFCAAWAVVVAQQPDTAQTGSQQICVLDGSATDSITGEPLRKVTVRLMSSSGGPEYVGTTDAEGRFHFEGFQAGDYGLEGERAGYLKISFGARRPQGRGAVLHFKSGDKLSNLELKLTSSSSLSGKVLDENGEPVFGTTVMAVNQVWVHGRREYRDAAQADSNDTGEYRIHDLAPGRYYLYARGQERRFVEDPGKPEEEMLPAFYPDSQTSASATAVDLEPAQNLTGLNFRLHIGEVFHVRGRVNAGALSEPLSRLSVMVNKTGLDSRVWGTDPSDIKGDGVFDIPGVPSDAYRAQVLERYRGAIVGTAPVEVKGANVDGIVISLNADLEVTGAIRIGADAGSAAGIRINAESVEGNTAGNTFYGTDDGNGGFRIQMPPGKYVLSANIPDKKEYVASIQYGGQEVLGAPVDFSSGAGTLEVLIKTGAGTIDGNVDSGDQQEQAASEAKPASAASIVLISEQPRLDDKGVLFAQADQNGHFSFKGVPPGKYYAFAGGDVDTGLWQNREFLAQIQAQGLEVDLPENGALQIRVPVLADDEVERALASLGQ